LKNEQENIQNAKHGAGIPGLNSKEIKGLRIPLPPLSVQCKIVEVLDNFTELTAELTARKKQYEYYRNYLMTFEDYAIKSSTGRQRIVWTTLGEIATITRGNGLQKNDFTESGVPCIHYGQIYTYYGTFASTTKSFVSPKLAGKLHKVQKGDIIVAVTSENVEDVCKCVAWLGDEEIVTGGHTAILKHNQNPKYIAYYLQTEAFFAQKRKIAHGTKVIEVTPSKLKNIQIPVPSLAEQARLVEILDRFDILTTDIANGLPAEIEARRKQYEYYRDKLFTFKEKTA
jgi:type I restriction enzyme S subunit